MLIPTISAATVSERIRLAPMASRATHPERFGTIAGAVRAPRGMIEFHADEAMEAFHIDHLKKDADLILICGAGGQAALAGKTLKEMGFTKVSNVGGFSAWKEAGGPVED